MNHYSNLVSLLDHTDTSSFIRSLYLPINKESTILRETYQNIVSYVFSDSSSLAIVRLNSSVHFLVDKSNALYEDRINPLASKLFRIHNFSYNKFIYGDCLLFGSYDSFTKESSLPHYSVPYDIIEQVTLLSKQ